MTDDNNPLAGTIAGLYRDRVPGGRELCVGVLVPSATLSRLAADLVVLIRQLAYVRKLTRIVQVRGSARRASVSAMFALYCAVDEARHKSANLLAPAEPQGAKGAVESLAFDGSDVSCEQVRALGLDVLLALDCDGDDRQLAGLCSSGIWHVDFAAGANGNLRLAGAEEFFGTAPESNLRLLQRGAMPSADRLLCELKLRVERGYSLVQSRERLLRESCQLMVVALHRLHAGVPLDCRPVVQPEYAPQPPAESLPRAEPPAGLPILSWLARPVVRRAKRLLRGGSATGPIWKIALRRLPADAPIDAVLHNRDGFRFLSAPRGYAWADPHLVDYQGRTLLFAEELKVDTAASGKIVCLEIDTSGSVVHRMVCVERPYHLSFPQVFVYGGEYFMIPESMMDGTIQLLRARRFPDDWVLEKVLLRAPAVDTVQWFDEPSGKWLFVTSMGSMVGQYPYTMVFVADSLTAPWRLHPCSPVSTAVETERNGGALFRRGAMLIRPVQDGRLRYGHALQWQEITEFSPSTFSERPCGRVEPDWAPGMLATHSYSRSRDWEALDALVVAESATERGQ